MKRKRVTRPTSGVTMSPGPFTIGAGRSALLPGSKAKKGKKKLSPMAWQSIGTQMRKDERRRRGEGVGDVRAQVRSLLSQYEAARNPRERKRVAQKLGQMAKLYSNEIGPDLMGQIQSAALRDPADWGPMPEGYGGPLIDPWSEDPSGWYGNQDPYANDPTGGGTTTDPGTYDPNDPMATLGDKMSAIESLLGMKGTGAKKFKQKWRKVRIILGNVYKASDGGAIAADDARLAMSKARQVTDEAAASFGRSVGPYGQGATEGGVFNQPQPWEAAWDESLLEPLPEEQLYDEYGYPIYGDAGPYDPYAQGATQSDVTFGWPINEADLYDSPGPSFYRPMQDDPYMIPDYPSWSAAGWVPEGIPSNFDGWGNSPPIDNEDAYVGDAFRDSPFENESFDDGLEMSADDLNRDTHAPSILRSNIDCAYGKPSIDSKPIPDIDTAYEAVSMMEDALGDITAVLKSQALPAFKDLSAEARRTGDPELVAHVEAARVALQDAIRARAAGLADIAAISHDGLEGFAPAALFGALRSSGILAISAAASLIAAMGMLGAGGKSALDSIGTGAKWGIGIGIPVGGTMLLGRKLGVI